MRRLKSNNDNYKKEIIQIIFKEYIFNLCPYSNTLNEKPGLLNVIKQILVLKVQRIFWILKINYAEWGKTHHTETWNGDLTA